MTPHHFLGCTEDWIVAPTTRQSVDVIYVDFSCAFEYIVFVNVIAKIEHYGLADRLLTWIAAFLHNRTQRIVLENCCSTVAYVNSGVV
jgi:hypothetical protein